MGWVRAAVTVSIGLETKGTLSLSFLVTWWGVAVGMRGEG